MKIARQTRTHARRLILFLLLLPFPLLAGWVMWGPWPVPENQAVPWIPDVILILGGGDEARAREAGRMALTFPDAPVLISGDEGHLENLLRADPITRARLVIEPDAESTWENAVLSEPFLEHLHATRVLLVTSWYHVSRTEAVFNRNLPSLEFAAAFEPPHLSIAPWNQSCQRREKLAALWYLARYGVNAF